MLHGFAGLGLSLLPCLTCKSGRIDRRNVPLVHPVTLRFPRSPTTRCLSHRCVLNSSLLITPIFSPSKIIHCCIPRKA